MDKPTVVDLFAGAGLFSFAFKAEGFEIVRSIEFDEAAARTYTKNLRHEAELADVSKSSVKGRCDVLIAGPPCQGFSTMGRPDGRDPRNRLSLEIVRFAATLKPMIVVIENVPPFVGSPMWKKLRHGLIHLGYDVSSITLDAVNFGVPQFRKRSFTFASKIKLEPIVKTKLYDASTVREAWRGLPIKPDGRNNHYSPPPSALTLERIKYIPPEGDRKSLMSTAPHLMPPSLRKLKSGVSDVWGRMKWDQPSNTIRTFMIHPSKGRYIHPEQDRVLSLREAARLQSIPDSWYFEGTSTQVARQIGIVCPPAWDARLHVRFTSPSSSSSSLLSLPCYFQNFFMRRLGSGENFGKIKHRPLLLVSRFSDTRAEKRDFFISRTSGSMRSD